MFLAFLYQSTTTMRNVYERKEKSERNIRKEARKECTHKIINENWFLLEITRG